MLPEDGGDMFRRNFGWLVTDYPDLSQKTELFITTAVRTSNPIVWKNEKKVRDMLN
jgi:hypothetical protein